ncbi:MULTISPECIES: ABZJ_00895 family protein [unclassified Thioalkalivibrio]|uniref:ABZJ_00895 family protein n=1 Tax=unclassified Thioalkalivibrio TaxID=2621013 RepID=UPI000376B972|nr:MULTISPECIES: ABZJ_00895 family protein [unclassified Thioalkalivibrio]
MSIKGLLFRFVLLYFALSIAAMVAGAYVDLDQAGTAIGMGILALAVVWPCESFGRRNGRYLSRAEKWRVIAAMIALLLGTQIPLTLLVMWAEGIALDAVMLGIVGGVALLYAGTVVAMVNFTGRNLRKRGLVAGESAG